MVKNDGGWLLPAVIDPPRRCICIPVPDDKNHRDAFFGALTALGYQHNWQRDDEHEAVPVSVVWYKIIHDAINRFNSGVDYMCFSCEQLAECLEPMLADLRAGIVQDLRYGADSGVPPGTKPPDSQNSSNVADGTNPECDKDITWAQATQITEWAIDLITDTLEIAEAATNDTEMLNVFGELPIINELGIAAVFAYIDLLLEGVAENFSAQITTLYEEEYACLIFQSACGDCQITPDRLYAVAMDRMREHFTDLPTTFNTIFDLWTYMSDQDIDGTTVADAMMLMFFGGGVLANAFFSAVSIKPMQIVAALAVNDANDDWLLLCPDCPTFSRLFDLTDAADAALWEIIICNDPQRGGKFEDGIGIWANHSAGGGCDQLIRMQIPVNREITRLTMTFENPIPAPTTSPDTKYSIQVGVNGWSSGVTAPDIILEDPITGTPDEFDWTGAETATSVAFQLVYTEDIGALMPHTIILVSVLIEGTGGLPAGW